MHRALNQFDINIASARQLGVVFEAFTNDLSKTVPLDELLRAEIVLVVSALDCYIHDLVRFRMASLLSLRSSLSTAFLNVGVSMNFVTQALGSASIADQTALFEQEIRRLHGVKTFQKASSISEALSLIGLQQVWDKVGAELGRQTTDIRTQLDLLVDRRNGIAHEGDIDPSAGFALKYPIDLTTTRKAADFIDDMVKAIHKVVLAEAPP